MGSYTATSQQIAASLRGLLAVENLGWSRTKRGLEYIYPSIYLSIYLYIYICMGYGLRLPTEIYGGEQEKAAFRESLQEACFLFLPEISRNLREFTGEGNLGILDSSSLS